MNRRSAVFLVLLILTLILIQIVSANRPQDDHWLCQTFTEHALSSAGREAVWDTPGYTFAGLPLDLGDIPIDPLYINEERSSAYMLMWSPSKQELWVFPYIDFETGGAPNGSHNFCMPRIYSLETSP